MPHVESRRSRQADRRSVVLTVLRDAGRPLSVDEVASASGIAVSTAQFHLSILMSAGLVGRATERSGSAGRPSWRYSGAPATPATHPAPPAASPAPYQSLASVLAAQLGGVAGAAAAAREAGRRWGDAMPEVALAPAASSAAAMDALTAALDGLGFAPEPRPSEREIVLRACPFEAVAREHRAVVCGVHLGLVERTAAAIGGGLVVEGLDPFRSEDPLACAVRLGSQS